MNVLILPVSGGSFVCQLGIIQHLCNGNIKPDIMLASSGGNIAAYISAAADWKWAGIERIAQEIKPEFLLQPWNNLSVLSTIIGYFKGNMFNSGIGIEKFLQEFFDKESIMKYEIWTGTYNQKLRKSKLFCNKKKEDCILDASEIDHDLTQSEEATYANGDFKYISTSCIASASIPGLVPPTKINDQYYIDGGVSCASPLTILHTPILNFTCKNKSKLHLIYINSNNLSSQCESNSNNILETFKQVTDDIIRCQNVTDRLSTYELLRCFPGAMNKEEFDCNPDNINHIKSIYEKSSYSMLEIYPEKKFSVDVSNFNNKDIVDNIKLAQDNCKCSFWWLSPQSEQLNSCKTDICRNL
jgi:hypothetical protein